MTDDKDDIQEVFDPKTFKGMEKKTQELKKLILKITKETNK